MATYNIGQIRRNQISSYSTKVNYKKGLIENDNSDMDFYDPYISPSDGSQISSSYNYYLRFRVKQRTDSAQNFSVKLMKNNELGENEYQTLRSFSVRSGKGINYITFEMIFLPNQDYGTIIFELKRELLDFETEEQGKSGRIMEIEIEEFCIINNIITSYLQSHFSGLETLKKIGIQGPPGLLFSIDGEEIRLGKTGIYELYNEKIQVSYLGFIIKNSVQAPDGKDFFILDFKY